MMHLQSRPRSDHHFQNSLITVRVRKKPSVPPTEYETRSTSLPVEGVGRRAEVGVRWILAFYEARFDGYFSELRLSKIVERC